MFDRNGDDDITKKELADSLENLEIYIFDVDLASMIEKKDADGDRCVDVDEFAMLYHAIMDWLLGGEEEEEMHEAFEVFDHNRDGFITVEELWLMLTSLGIKQGRTTEDCKRMISTMDANSNRMVGFKEFKLEGDKRGMVGHLGVAKVLMTAAIPTVGERKIKYRWRYLYPLVSAAVPCSSMMTTTSLPLVAEAAKVQSLSLRVIPHHQC
ncbi:calmodulin-like protein 3 [Canna indica]|uniref:Calmodulin-like protein 3 n=1 Tax=Canna indica TaxID=4628 RepID=A0AAQ3Q280_9LILI|nr:calmodulin-like protein 3 [Canna indica]